MIYTLKASKRRFEVVQHNSLSVKVRFLDGRAAEQTIGTRDLIESSDWTRPIIEKPVKEHTCDSFCQRYGCDGGRFGNGSKAAALI